MICSPDQAQLSSVCHDVRVTYLRPCDVVQPAISTCNVNVVSAIIFWGSHVRNMCKCSKNMSRLMPLFFIFLEVDELLITILSVLNRSDKNHITLAGTEDFGYQPKISLLEFFTVI